MIEHINDGEDLLAIIVYSNFSRDGIEFFTPPDLSQQLGYMSRPKGYKIPPHLHVLVDRTVNLTSEVLFLKRGKVKVDFYDADERYICSKILAKGDVILLVQGGHGFEIMEDAEIIEVKQGPYSGELDKVRF